MSKKKEEKPDPAEEWEVEFYGGPIDGFHEILPFSPPIIVRTVGDRKYIYSKARDQKGGPIRYDYLEEQRQEVKGDGAGDPV